MSVGYTRQAAADIAAGLTILSADLNAEYNQLQSAFDNTSGHDHSGSAAGTGAKLPLTTSVSGILPVANGGTGIASGTSGGILAYTAAGTLASSAALTANAIVLGGGAGVAPTVVGSLGTTTTLLHGNASGAPSFGAAVLTTDVSGILPIANGGTNNSSAYTAGSVIFSSGTALTQDNATLFWDSTNHRLAVGTNGTTNPWRVVIQGTGTSSATYGLVVQNSVGTQGLTVRDDGLIGATSWSITTAGIATFTSGLIGSAGGSTVTPITATTNILLYNTSPTNWAGMGASTGGNIFFAAGTTGVSTRMVIGQTGGIQFNSYGAGTLTTDASGNITAASDEALKNIQGTYDKGLSALLPITPINFTWKPESNFDTTTSYTGFSAQNVQNTIAEAVGKNSDGTLTLSERTLLATVVNALKEINTRLETLENK